MGKKGIVTSAIETAVKAAEKALAPSPLAKRIVATAASQVIAAAEDRARETVAPIDKAIKKATAPATKEPRTKAKQQAQQKQTRTEQTAASRRKSGARKSAASRKKTKSASARGASGASKSKSGRGKKQAKSKRR